MRSSAIAAASLEHAVTSVGARTLGADDRDPLAALVLGALDVGADGAAGDAAPTPATSTMLTGWSSSSAEAVGDVGAR